jgi:magnesium transporter
LSSLRLRKFVPLATLVLFTILGWSIRVKLISGALSHENEGNQVSSMIASPCQSNPDHLLQILHPAAFVTFIFLALSAVFQIICLNKGLKVYDSTRECSCRLSYIDIYLQFGPSSRGTNVLCSVYCCRLSELFSLHGRSRCLQAMGKFAFDPRFQDWHRLLTLKQTLFAVFVSIGVLIGGVVLLTNKKPEPKAPSQNTILGPVPRTARRGRKRPKDLASSVDSPSEWHGDREDDALRRSDENEDETVWQIGDDEDDEEGDDPTRPSADEGNDGKGMMKNAPIYSRQEGPDGRVPDEVRGILHDDEDEDEGDAEPSTSRSGTHHVHFDRTAVHHSSKEDDDHEFGDWEDGGKPSPEIR